MNLLLDGLAWLFSPLRLGGSHPLPQAALVHVSYIFSSVALAAVIAIPAGWLIGHTGRGRELTVGVSGAARAIPTFGLILLLVLLLGVTRKPEAAMIAFVLLAIPPILAGAYAGLEAIDRRTIGAARAQGMTEWQILRRVEAPLGLALLIAGVRAAVLQVGGTVTLAAYVNLGGLGFYIIQGIALRRFEQVLGGALAVATVALALDAVFALLQKTATPAHLRSRPERGSVRRALGPSPVSPRGWYSPSPHGATVEPTGYSMTNGVTAHETN